MESLIEALRKFIVAETSYSGPADSLTPDFPLIEKKVVDSLAIAQLVTFIEDTYEVEIEEDELVGENFGTLADMARFVKAKVDA